MSVAAPQQFKMQLDDQEYLRIRCQVDFDDERFQDDYRYLRSIHNRPGKMNEGALMLMALRQHERRERAAKMRAGKEK